ncbi:MAG: hypothetical protein OPY08_06465 [Nitrosopumilus sp.]|nr:hypothetical protein [Nitrosopumilus sp.]MDF2424182.1 hypothetical protein [Nitrosopumilus sp.]MDF2426056.1 hypothetical protein [Nitrosopumilus sp.]MDF2426332.1 hypothetical protein [Nitrosopumilus sp.]MDF2428208.1 hypothetical protein [Nitrosopumilus sp.]
MGLFGRMFGKKDREPLKNVSGTSKKDVRTATAFCQNIPRKKHVVHVMNKAHPSF